MERVRKRYSQALKQKIMEEIRDGKCRGESKTGTL